MSSLSIPGVVVLDLTLTEDAIEDGAREILKSIRPDWNQDDVIFKVYTAGISNKLIGCRRKNDTDYDDSVLVRIYGKNTEVMINRDMEMLTMYILNQAGCCKGLYAKFPNGISYGFTPGTCLNAESVRDEHIGKLVAEEMVHVGALDPVKNAVGIPVADLGGLADREPSLFKRLRNMMSQAPRSFPDAEKTEKLKRVIPDYPILAAEVDLLEEVVSSLGCPLAFNHNDLLLNNLVFSKKHDRCFFIDFEYQFYNYHAYEVGNHFCEWAGVDEVDYSRYPDKLTQLRWLRHYLIAYNSQQGRSEIDPTVVELERFYVQVNKCALAAHLFWGMWALVQARYSTIDFDYLEYAKLRLDEYFRRKDDFLALKMPA